jgi:hypothetical protein
MTRPKHRPVQSEHCQKLREWRGRSASRLKRCLLGALVLAATSCSTTPGRDGWFGLSSPKQLEQLQAAVKNADSRVRESVPELKYAASLTFGGLQTVPIKSAEGKRFEILVLYRPSESFPGEDFVLAYLRDAAGQIVDWKSKWLYNRRGMLGTRVLDLDRDGVKDFCFVSKAVNDSEQFLGAYEVKGCRFEPVIAEETAIFDIDLGNSTNENGIVIEPKPKTIYCQLDRLYEIPLTFVNRSQSAASLKGRYLVPVVKGFNTLSVSAQLVKEILQPGESLQTEVTVKLSPSGPAEPLRFRLEQGP